MKDLKSFQNKQDLLDIFNLDYNLTVVDGGLIANAPILFGYTECRQLWPDQDICILSIGTGSQSPLNAFDHKEAFVYIQSLFQTMHYKTMNFHLNISKKSHHVISTEKKSHM